MSKAITAGLAPIRQLKRPRDLSREFPEVEIRAMDAKWYRIAGFDSAIVSMNDGTSAALYQRDRERYKALVRRTVQLHNRFRRDWDEIAAQYRTALGDITSPETWEKTFAPWTEGETR
jgi:galactofuranosylgalactofuranosylrhamnosyl-N-acetylglucosaminyl-diphospho-decaprenol beta-1,5/1,6-galactofuranosyltransferase